MVVLNQRYGGIKMPDIELADVKDEAKRKTMRQNFTSKLTDHITMAFARNEQVILLQNRRGYVPRHECVECGWVPDCINCDISLTYHKATHQLRCHYCGHTAKPVAICGACGSPDVRTKGFGTEKIEEEIALFFPNKKVARLDQDVTKTKNAFAKIIQDLEQNNTDILIGTQMVAKGLDFDNVTLVGVLDADQALSYPDFRATEKCFQLLLQVSGRAGRRNTQGKVIIQTKRATTPVFQYVINGDYKTFAETELLQRNQFHYPPYCKIIKISVRHVDFDAGQKSALALCNALRQGLGKTVLGPALPPVARIRNLYYQEIMIKISPEHSPPKIKKYIAQQLLEIQSLVVHKSTQFVIDVEPE
jgi:primosomal protein N' (replication factor Y)